MVGTNTCTEMPLHMEGESSYENKLNKRAALLENTIHIRTVLRLFSCEAQQESGANLV